MPLARGLSNTRAQLYAAHDFFTRIGFVVAYTLLGIIVCSLIFEIVARYFLNAPTEWASRLVSYCLLASIFFAMPELTRKSAHLSISFIFEAIGPAHGLILSRVISLVAAITCFFATWFTANETYSQYILGIGTGPPFSIPKWIVSISVPYGMFSSGLYFVRQLVSNLEGPILPPEKVR